MATTLNVQPPQTYSRLFRPWDNNNKASGSHNVGAPTTSIQTTSMATTSKSMWRENSSKVKLERCSPPNQGTVSEQSTSSFYSNANHDSDRECGSSHSSSSSSSGSSGSSGSSSSSSNSRMSAKTSYENTINNMTFLSSQQQQQQQQQIQQQHHIHPDPSLYGISSTRHVDYFFNTQARIYNNMENDNLLSMSTATQNNNKLFYAAAAAAAASGIVPTAAATTTTINSFGVDPYTLGLMEHEYTRVMAEEAQLKALNARKQRPKKFKCPHCDVAFSNNGQLKGHIRIHTGERPFKCDVESCGKTFTRNEELTRHKRIHTGLRPYPCTICGKKFGRRDHLKKHMKTHMPQERQLGPAIYVPMYPYLYGY